MKYTVTTEHTKTSFKSEAEALEFSRLLAEDEEDCQGVKSVIVVSK